MSSTGLQRSFSEVGKLHDHPFFKETGLKEELPTGEVFPAIRKDEVHFYYGGARLCVYDGKQMYTNKRYLGIEEGSSSDVRIKPDWFTPDKYKELKKNCLVKRRPEAELSTVSRLFSEFSIASSSLPTDRARLLDIECRFPSESNKAQEMIDCLFLTPKGMLVFVEVKRTDNDEARSSGPSAAVVTQLEGYRKQLKSEGARKEIKDLYTSVIDSLGRILNREDLPRPNNVFESVPLLIVGPASPPSPRSREVWQQKLLATPLSLDSLIIGIDGRDDRMVGALDDFFRVLDGELAEAASQ